MWGRRNRSLPPCAAWKKRLQALKPGLRFLVGLDNCGMTRDWKPWRPSRAEACAYFERMFAEGAEGFYFDQGSSNIRITSNVVYRIQDAPYNVSSPNRNIRADNNVFGFSSNYFLTAPLAKESKGSTGNLCERCVMLYDERMRSLFPRDRGPVDTNGTVFARNVWIKSDKRNLDGQALMPSPDDKVACAEGFRPFAIDVPTARPGLRPATHSFPIQPPRNHAKHR